MSMSPSHPFLGHTTTIRKEPCPHLDQVVFTQAMGVRVQIRHVEGMAFEPELVVWYHIRPYHVLSSIQHMGSVLRPAKFVFEYDLARERLNPCYVLPNTDETWRPIFCACALVEIWLKLFLCAGNTKIKPRW